MNKILISELKQQFCFEIAGVDVEVSGLCLLFEQNTKGIYLSYITSSSMYNQVLENKSIGVLLVSPQIYDEINNKDDSVTFIIALKPELLFYRIHEYLVAIGFYEGLHTSTSIGNNCHIHPTVIIEDGVEIFDNVTIGAYSIIRKGSVLYKNVKIGSFTVIGSEGFQVLINEEIPFTVTHIGKTIIKENVYIGDHVTIGNGLFLSPVIIGQNTKIDNHVHIAHNCFIGDNNVITAGVTFLGSSRIGNSNWISPEAVINNRVIIQDHVHIGVNSVVNKNVKSCSTLYGFPAISIDKFARREQFLKKNSNSKK